MLTTNLGALVCRCRFGVEFPFNKSSIEQVMAAQVHVPKAMWRTTDVNSTLLKFYSDLNLFACRSIAHCASNVLRTISMRVVKAENDHLQLHMLHRPGHLHDKRGSSTNVRLTMCCP